MKFSIKDFFSKCDQIRSLLKKSLMENFISCAVSLLYNMQGKKIRVYIYCESNLIVGCVCVYIGII